MVLWIENLAFKTTYRECVMKLSVAKLVTTG